MNVDIQAVRNALFSAALLCICMVISPPSAGVAIPSGGDGSVDEKPESPWMLTPLVSSAPKFGTSIGAMAGYLHKFDEHSPTSMFALVGSYSNTDSMFYGGFARTFFDQDKQRLIAGGIHGEINNEYTDFLGTGLQVNTTDDINALFLRYTFRVHSDWFVGPQVMSTDYAITGNDPFSQQVIALLGLTGFDSTGVGLVVERDTRDNQNAPASGSLLGFNNVAYRESLGGDYSFDVFSFNARKYYSHGNGNVLAVRLDGRWTDGAPPGGYSSVRLRGYTSGQYLAPHSTLIEAEERYPISGRWGGTVFTGVACLYGDDRSCFDNENLYPTIGAGITFMLKLEEKMIARTELAKGEGENYGFYMKFGYEF